MVHTKWWKRVLVVLIAQCQHPSPRRAPWYFHCRPLLCLSSLLLEMGLEESAHQAWKVVPLTALLLLRMVGLS